MPRRAPFLALCTVAVTLRLYAAWLEQYANNWDVRVMWRWLAQTIEAGQPLYGTTHWNYGLPWAYLCWALWRVARWWTVDTATPVTAHTMTVFHLLLACMTSAADCVTLGWLRRYVGWVAACLFALSPVLIVVTGFHTQVDEVSLPFALYALTCLHQARLVPAILLMATSLVIKHDWVYFVAWMAAMPPTQGQT